MFILYDWSPSSGLTVIGLIDSQLPASVVLGDLAVGSSSLNIAGYIV